MTTPTEALCTAAGAFVGYLIADLVSGVFHWSVDNYGDGRTPVFGAVIEAFQGHHGEFTRRPASLPASLQYLLPCLLPYLLPASRRLLLRPEPVFGRFLFGSGPCLTFGGVVWCGLVGRGGEGEGDRGTKRWEGEHVVGTLGREKSWCWKNGIYMYRKKRPKRTHPAVYACGA